MPIASYDLQHRVTRFHDQRWLLDTVIRRAGLENDQSRLHRPSAPMISDHQGAVLGLEPLIERWDDLTPESAKLARRSELQGQAIPQQGHEVMAADSSFAALWPVYTSAELNGVLELKKTACSLAYVAHADHLVEFPYRGRTLAGHWSVPLPYLVIETTGFARGEYLSLSGPGDLHCLDAGNGKRGGGFQRLAVNAVAATNLRYDRVTVENPVRRAK